MNKIKNIISWIFGHAIFASLLCFSISAGLAYFIHAMGYCQKISLGVFSCFIAMAIVWLLIAREMFDLIIWGSDDPGLITLYRVGIKGRKWRISACGVAWLICQAFCCFAIENIWLKILAPVYIIATLILLIAAVIAPFKNHHSDPLIPRS